ncbi:MAG: anhydro-N-acetylmuramic acid kinase [Chthonomonadales bacterium]
MLIIGLMSGTSADGVDVVLVEITERDSKLHVDLKKSLFVPYSEEMREAIFQISNPDSVRLQEIVALNPIIGELFGEAALSLCKVAGCDINDVDAIGSHGQTIWHQPVAIPIGGVAGRGTLQIGSAAVISAITGQPVVSDFRSADMAVGGQGAPLVPYADWKLFGHPVEDRLMLNIGGIANVTWLPAGCTRDEIIAFDTGPGNMLIDLAAYRSTAGAQMMDVDGQLARRGKVIDEFVNILNDHEYFDRPLPKSTGREMFGEYYFRHAITGAASNRGIKGKDFVATITAFTARTIADAVRNYLPERASNCDLICAGGGVLNPTLMMMLASELPGATIKRTDEFGVPTEAWEAIAFAILSHATLTGKPSNVPSATGASRPVILGSITNVNVA